MSLSRLPTAFLFVLAVCAFAHAQSESGVLSTPKGPKQSEQKSGDGVDATFQIASAPVGNDFALIKYNVKTGEVWYHNEKDTWSRASSEDSVAPGNFVCVVAPYSTIGRVNPLAGITSPKYSYTVFRMDRHTGESWKLEDGVFQTIPDAGWKPATTSPEYELICNGVGSLFAVYKYERATGAIAEYSSGKWKSLWKDDLPSGMYDYQIVLTKGGTSHRLFRIDRTSGQTWDLIDGKSTKVGHAGN